MSSRIASPLVIENIFLIIYVSALTHHCDLALQPHDPLTFSAGAFSPRREFSSRLPVEKYDVQKQLIKSQM